MTKDYSFIKPGAYVVLGCTSFGKKKGTVLKVDRVDKDSTFLDSEGVWHNNSSVIPLKLKKGMCIRLKADLEAREYADGLVCTYSMLRYKEMVGVITQLNYDKDRFRLTVDDNTWYWSAELLDSVLDSTEEEEDKYSFLTDVDIVGRDSDYEDEEEDEDEEEEDTTVIVDECPITRHYRVRLEKKEEIKQQISSKVQDIEYFMKLISYRLNSIKEMLEEEEEESTDR